MVLCASAAAPGLWWTDVTTTQRLGNLVQVAYSPPLVPVGNGSSPGEPAGFLFSVAATPFDHELWFTDGTASGTRLASDARPGELGIEPTHLLALESAPIVVFRGADDFGRELWSSDGTPSGTVRRTDIAPGAASSEPTPLGAQGRWLLLSANDGTSGVEP